MKKKLLLIILVLVLVSITTLAIYFLSNGDEDMPVVELTPEPTPEPTEEPTEEIREGGTPLYPQVNVESANALLEWIRMVDAETFQDGRYKQVVSRLRAEGRTLVPDFDILDAELSSITVLQDEVLPAGTTSIFYVFFIDGERVAVSVSNLNEDYFAHANGVLHEYAITLYGGIWLEGTLSEATIQIIAENDLQIETVPYLLASSPADSARPFMNAMFIIDGLEVTIQQDRDLFREDILSSLQLEMVAIEG